MIKVLIMRIRKGKLNQLLVSHAPQYRVVLGVSLLNEYWETIVYQIKHNRYIYMYTYYTNKYSCVM